MTIVWNHFYRRPFLFVLAWMAAWFIEFTGLGLVTAAETLTLTISPDTQFAYAETLFQDRDFRTAEVEFKRFIHFFPGDPRILEARFKTGLALFHQERFHEAARQFNDIIINDNELSFSFTKEAFFMQSKAFRQMGNLAYAQVVLQNFLHLTDDPDLRDRILLDLAGLHINASRQPGTNELDMALAFLKKMSSNGLLDDQRNELIHRILAVRSMPGKNPVLAGLFSVVPGGGFLYTGRIRDAAAAFFLNAGLGLAAWKAFEQDNPALGGVISFVGAGFYSGSIYGSVSAAHKFNHARKIEILERPFYLSGACARMIRLFHSPLTALFKETVVNRTTECRHTLNICSNFRTHH